MPFTSLTILPAAPEIFVVSMACAILLLDAFLPEARRTLSYGLAQATLIGAAALTVLSMPSAPVMAFNGMFVSDPLAAALKLGVYTLTFFVFAYSRDYLRARGMFRGEFFVLGLLGVVGMMVLISAAHFLTLYLGLELLSLSLYALIAFQRDSIAATEAAMKYFVLGAIASGMLLYGMSILYGVTGSLDIATVRGAVARVSPDDVMLTFGLVFVIAGIAFKLGAVPFHMWVPDVYHGAPTAVTLYIGTAPKVAAFALVMRLLVAGLGGLSGSWQGMLIVLAVLSLVVGNVAAIAQTNLKRMLAYSSIAHMGYFLLGILSASANGYSSAMFYIFVYAVMSLGSFGMIVLMSRAGFEAEDLADFKGLNQRNPWQAFLMLLLMLSMAGIPPTAGFYAKFLVIQAAINAGLVWLAVLAVVFAVVGAFYYLRVVKLMYFDDAPAAAAPIEAGRGMRVLLGVNALSLLGVMPWAGALTQWCEQAIRSAAGG